MNNQSIIITLLLLAAAAPFSQVNSQTVPPTYSSLWGEEDGENWTPTSDEKSFYPEDLITDETWNPDILPDFTNVGYMNGDVAIPDWPVGVNVKDHGAVGDGENDDTQAFRDAIAACGENEAIFVPNGRYKITDRILITNKDNFVLRGEDMYATVLWFPKSLGDGDLYPEVDHSKGGGYAFFEVYGGNGRSIENFTFEFREERMVTHFNNSGAAAIYYSKNGNVQTKDSWIRNIYIKNANDGIRVNGQNITIMNIILDQYESRPSEEEATVGHHGIFLTGARNCLIHNVFITGKWQHEMGTGGDDRFNVFSRITTMVDSQIDHHAQNAQWNLWTEIDVGEGYRVWSQGGAAQASTDNEFYWNITADEPMPYPPTSRENVVVGFKTDMSTDIGSDYRHETIDPNALIPVNLYIAQMEKKGKPIPGPTIEFPDRLLPDPNTIIAIEDAWVSNGDRDSLLGSIDYDRGAQITLKHGNFQDKIPYFKFDLSAIEPAEVISATLRIYCNGKNNGTISVTAIGVDNDSWDEHTITYNNQPRNANDTQIAVATVDVSEQWYEWDVTSFVNQELAGDKIVTIYLDDLVKTDIPSYWRTKEGAIYHPQIVITANLAVDSDADGIADAWEIENFGNVGFTDGSIDSDNDGMLDFFEYLYGSDPNNASSNGFKLTVSSNEDGTSIVFNWEVLETLVLGQDYQVYISTDLDLWGQLPADDYSLTTTPAAGRSRIELTLTADYGEKAFLKLVRP